MVYHIGVRSLFLFLSQRRLLRRWIETSAFARRLSKRFVAGETLREALVGCRRLKSENIAATLDHLGESVTSLAESAEARDHYLTAMEALRGAGLEANVSIKLTQFGLDYSYDECKANVERLVAQACDMKGFVRVDMESSEYTDRTIQLVRELHSQRRSVGVVIQACLYRSLKDIERLCNDGIRVRLCKGAYLEPASVAFPKKADVDANYVRLMKTLLDSGSYPAIATHDPAIIAEAKSYVAARRIPHNAFEFQMLYGIRRDLQKRIVAEGYRLRLYVPFGSAWYPYYMRRLAERPANVLFILRNLFRQ
jgi:proline dehydrogenase